MVNPGNEQLFCICQVFQLIWDLSNPKAICKSIFSFSRDSMYTEQTLPQPGANIGPLSFLTGSELLDLAFLVIPWTLSKCIFSTSDNSSISQIFHKLHNQLLQTHLEKCQHRNLIQYSHITTGILIGMIGIQ